MDYLNLLEDYIDGGLDPAKEEELFFHLSVNEELRIQMRRMLALEASIKDNTEYFTPPSNVVMGLFNRLDIPTKATSVASIGLLTRLKIFYSKYSKGIITGILSFVGGVVLTLLLLRQEEPFSKGEINSGNLAFDATEKAQIPEITNIDFDAIALLSNYQGAEGLPDKITSASPAKSISNVTNESESNANSREIEPIVASNMQSIPYTEIPGVKNTLRTTSQLHPGSTAFSLSLNPGNSGLMLEFHGSNDWHLPAASISPKQYAGLNNTAFAALYQLSDRFALGIDYRRENFFLKYESTEELNEKYIYEIQPNLESVCLIGRYHFSEYDLDRLGHMNTFGQLSVGGNSIGMVGRLMGGIKYHPNAKFAFLLGIEYSHLGYNHQGETFHSGKVGLHYGISYRF